MAVDVAFAAAVQGAAQPASEMHPRVRRQILDKIQQVIHEGAMFAGVIEPAFLNGVGARPAVHGPGLIQNLACSASFEDLKLTGK